MDSILLTIKKMLGVENEFDGFDIDITFGINTAFMSLEQLGVGPLGGYNITGLENVWGEFLGTITNIEAVKNYIYLKTRLIFDPPSSSFLINAIENQIKEIEYRLVTQIEHINYIEPEV